MHYTIWAHELGMIPPDARQQMQEWLSWHGVQLDRCAGFTYDQSLHGIWVQYYQFTPLGQVRRGLDDKALKEETWIPLKEGEKLPPFLHWMSPGTAPPKYLPKPGTDPTRPRIVDVG